MLKFKGRIMQKITIPSKPIPTGFKLFILSDSGYIYNWEYTSPSLIKRVLKEKKRISINILISTISTFLNPTQSIIIRLIECLSIYINKSLLFYLFLDNLLVY
jgi:hypothetical protein